MTDSGERSNSITRGRDLQSTGRGGIGNIRQTSSSRDARPGTGPDDFSQTRGREPHIPHMEYLFSTGRGGTGNIRSPSRDPAKVDPTDAADQKVVHEHIVADEAALHSSGRGGLGNINRSRSREPHSATDSTFNSVHSSGRGGAGNIHPGAVSSTIDEEERLKHLVPAEIHSTGRGGAANVTPIHEPTIEHHGHQASEYESSGRGGAGNIVHGKPA